MFIIRKMYIANVYIFFQNWKLLYIYFACAIVVKFLWKIKGEDRHDKCTGTKETQ